MAIDLTGARSLVTSLMPDTCSITRPGGNPEDVGVLDDDTGALTMPADAAVFAGPIMVGGLKSRLRTVDGQLVTEAVASSMIPWDAPIPAEGDHVTITAVGTGSDPTLLGRSFTIVSVGHGSYIAGRTLDLVALSTTAPRDE